MQESETKFKLGGMGSLSVILSMLTTIDISHVYSYNKVMSKNCLKGIGKALSNTNFKILAWYVNEKYTYKIVK